MPQAPRVSRGVGEFAPVPARRPRVPIGGAVPDDQLLPQTLAQLIRAKYPGEYDDLSDHDLEEAVLAKYPEYGDLPRTPRNASDELARRLGGRPVTGSQSRTTADLARQYGGVHIVAECNDRTLHHGN